MEDGETGIFDETRRHAEERNQKLQSHSLEVGDVELVCQLCHFAT